MERVLLDEVIHTDYGQFDLAWDDDLGFDGDWDRSFAGQTNGLVGAASGHGVYVNLGRRSGGSSVRIVLHDSAPALEEQWEDVVEVSTSVPAGAQVSWSTWAGETHGPLELPSGTYRLRVSARGRDAGHEDEFADGVVDFYVIAFWPAPSVPDAVVRVGSDNAAYWHREVGGLR